MSSDDRLELMWDCAALFLKPSSTRSAAEVGSGLCWNLTMSGEIAELVRSHFQERVMRHVAETL